MEFDVVVIGSGPGGYVSAIRAAQLGAKVCVIEKGDVGGVCLNAGCIPTKTLIASAEIFNRLGKVKEFGIKVNNLTIDYPSVIARKEKIVRRLQAGISGLFKSNKIEFIKGEAKFLNKNELNVTNTSETVKFKKCVIATGSKIKTIPGITIDGNTVISSTELLSLKSIPASLLVIGGGIIGTEFASLFNRFGSKVTIVEMLSGILAGQDEEVSAEMTRLLKKKGIDILTNSKLLDISGNSAKIEKPDGKIKIEAEKILICIGREPNYKGIGLEKINIQTENGRIKVNERMETSVNGIYAVGDVTGKYLLAYVSSAEGIVAAENACGKDSTMDYKIIPACIFTSPEIGNVGLTESEAISQGRKLKTGKFPFIANGRAHILNETEGFVKVVADAKTNQILGVHIIGTDASELIHIASMAMKMEATTEEFTRSIFNHPTLSESILEAAYDVNKEAIDIPKICVK